MEGEHSMNFTNFWLEKFKGGDNLEGLGVDETILKWISIRLDGNEDREQWLACYSDNECSSPIKGRQFLE